MIDLRKGLKVIADHRTDEILVASMSSIYHWHFFSEHEADMTFTDPMGGGSGLALGLAMGRPDVRVLLLQGDGSLLMYPGALVTIGEMGPQNLVIFLMHNGLYTVPEHPIPGAGKVDFCGLARAAGIQRTYDIASLEDLAVVLPSLKKTPGPHFVSLRVTSSVSPRTFGIQERARPQAFERFGRNGARNLRSYLERRPETLGAI